jgi:hypothetical protein
MSEFQWEAFSYCEHCIENGIVKDKET